MSAPFGATVPGARLLAVQSLQAEGIPVGAPRASVYSDDTVGEWLEQGGSRVAVRILRYELLPAQVIDTITEAARGLTELYAAAFLFDATRPERAGSAGRLGGVLWERFQRGLDELAATVRLEIDRVGINADESVTGPGAIGHFRRPSGWEQKGF